MEPTSHPQCSITQSGCTTVRCDSVNKRSASCRSRGAARGGELEAQSVPQTQLSRWRSAQRHAQSDGVGSLTLVNTRKHDVAFFTHTLPCPQRALCRYRGAFDKKTLPLKDRMDASQLLLLLLVYGHLPKVLSVQMCDVVNEIELERSRCEDASFGNVSSGCQGMWDIIACWPSARVGEVVTITCPTYFSYFSDEHKESPASVLLLPTRMSPFNPLARLPVFNVWLSSHIWLFRLLPSQLIEQLINARYRQRVSAAAASRSAAACNLSKTCTADGWTEMHPIDIAMNCGYNLNSTSDDGKFFWQVKIGYTIGHSVSLISLTTAIVILCIFRKLHCTRNYIHMHLFVSFILKAIAVFVKDVVLYEVGEVDNCSSGSVSMSPKMRLVFAADSHRRHPPAAYRCTTHPPSPRAPEPPSPRAPEPTARPANISIDLSYLRDAPCSISALLRCGSWGVSQPGTELVGCKVVIVFFQYCIMASFFWLLVEGLYLHALLAVSFFSERKYFWAYILIGWGGPTIFTTAWSITKAYFNDVGRLAKSTLLLIPLFGINFIVFAFIPEQMKTELRLVFDLILGSFQGFVVAVLYCFLNGEVQGEIRRKWRRWHLQRYMGSDTKYQHPSIGNSNNFSTQISMLTRCSPKTRRGSSSCNDDLSSI
ncbi:Vasoactive intestinal polypeptide receptor [Liparis tanakae]|uniref:Vasoactive intestinal polypeptide receptor n=1 Tax=Liparis tanakae TaxID=230148 RepID=A0A4Z2JFQ6_9TELE|nr:Vasoactive intestinal polypeptide receptor [Liparis tanakae]